MLERFVEKTTFTSQEDFEKNLKIKTPENFNFGYDVVDAWAAEEPEKIAIRWTNDHGAHIDFTYAELKKKTDQTAAYFQSLGIGKGDMVMLILKRRYEFWFSIIALHKIGAVAIPATHLLTEKDIIYRAQAATIKAIVCVGEDVVLEHVKNSLPKSPSVEYVISVGPNVPEGFLDFTKGIESAPEFKPKRVNTNHDISLMYFTSGTTGNPKMVAHDFCYPLGHIVTGSFWHNLHEGSLHLTVADTGWGKAVWGKLYGQMIAGATIFVYDHEKFTPADMLKMIQDYKITSFCAPPTIFRFMILEDLRKYDLSSLKWCTIAGEALNPSVYEEFHKLTGVKLHEGFGQTETTCTVLTTPWMEPKPGSMGRPNPAYDIDIVDEEGKPVEQGTHGEIVIRATRDNKPNGLFLGYYRAEELTENTWHDGVYHTGDVAWRDEDGYLWFVGRNDDVIKSSGYRIGPFEVESALMTHPAVAECAITGVPDPVRGQVVKATIVLKAEFKDKAGDDLVKDIQNHVKHTTAPYKYPRVVEFVDVLPKTISGKIKRVDLRK
ncbi:MAG: acetyl-CoA synthetase [Bacteroidales bacterium]|nr:acetyl-CoA synthetase [Bacteroidales bacterium]MBP5134982.1 AMP-binding protein [Paludibacteraceae bacterium]